MEKNKQRDLLPNGNSAASPFLFPFGSDRGCALPAGVFRHRLGASRTVLQAFAGFLAPRPGPVDGVFRHRLGASTTVLQGFAGFLAPSPAPADGFFRHRLGASTTILQAFAGFLAPSPGPPPSENMKGLSH